MEHAQSLNLHMNLPIIEDKPWKNDKTIMSLLIDLNLPDLTLLGFQISSTSVQVKHLNMHGTVSQMIVYKIGQNQFP